MCIHYYEGDPLDHDPPKCRLQDGYYRYEEDDCYGECPDCPDYDEGE